ncbi:histone deacetylase HDT1-like [Amaranthus tricolor]|uniref:histone deacetylase HDT1-like n=1 Tax=Amaranthus tricolor TaxID=29722 RepID=UPI00258A4DF8|nr:histone deacetylase HDT1-like [Amaranthus tricolor]
MANMQFWGVDVKAKEPAKVTVDEGQIIHLSQATLSELKKDNEPVLIHVKVGDQKLVLGMLNQTTPQLSFDLVFDQDFEISHNWKNGSIHLLGYQTEMDDGDADMFPDSSDDEEVPVLQKENGKPAEASKKKAVAKPAKDDKPKPEEKDDSDEDDSDDDDDEDDSDDEDESDEDMMGKIDDSDEDDDEDDSDEESEDEKPAKVASGKKRPNAEAKTPEAKKAKIATPQKTDGKKNVHTATPHPSKKGGKSPGGDKATPKSGGQLSCGSCKKTFNSDIALQSHNKAKHAGK